jgi:hypothetical protein
LPSPKSCRCILVSVRSRDQREFTHEPELVIVEGRDGSELELEEVTLTRVEVDGMDTFRLRSDGVVQSVVSVSTVIFSSNEMRKKDSPSTGDAEDRVVLGEVQVLQVDGRVFPLQMDRVSDNQREILRDRRTVNP